MLKRKPVFPVAAGIFIAFRQIKSETPTGGVEGRGKTGCYREQQKKNQQPKRPFYGGGRWTGWNFNPVKRRNTGPGIAECYGDFAGKQGFADNALVQRAAPFYSHDIIVGILPDGADVKRVAVLFENDEILVLNKPAGLAVQGGKGIGVSLDSILAEEYVPRPLLVHRLDRDTSGVILTAKNPRAAARFSRLFAEGKTFSPNGAAKPKDPARSGGGLLKQYRAVCAGRPPEDAGVIHLALNIRGAEKTARTAYKRLAGNGDFSFLELELETGRMHQIRRHLAQTGNPVLGDDKYGNFALNRKLRKTMGLKRLLLHAARLIIPPSVAGTSGPLDISAPLPEYFTPFLDLFL
jgi:23S rRNA pseudouridine955/2504/2580 synthase